MKKNTSAKMIKKAIDSYPGGICFSTLDGRVILVNEKMNQLILELTGHTILNAKAAWEKLTNFANNGKAEKLNQSCYRKIRTMKMEAPTNSCSSASPTARSGVLN